MSVVLVVAAELVARLHVCVNVVAAVVVGWGGCFDIPVSLP